jgi:hypothetical protein
MSPVDISSTAIQSSTKLGGTLDFKNSLLKESSLTINTINFNDRFTYPYDSCIAGSCTEKTGTIISRSLTNYNKTILKLDSIFKMDNSIKSLNIKNTYDLIYTYGVIKYVYNGKYKYYDLSLVNLTPKNNKDGSTYIEVLEELKDAFSIELIFTIRNKQYAYIIRW